MSAYFSICRTPAGFLLLMLALALLLGQTAAFLLCLRENRSGRRLLAAALHLLAGFLLFVLLLESYDLVKYPAPKITRHTVPFRGLIQSLPWLIYAVSEFISAAILTLQIRSYLRFRRTTVTPDAIRRTVDLLPEGICVGAADGTVLLVNLKMYVLCRELTGEGPADAHGLWTWLEENGEDQSGKRLIRTPAGETWLFTKGTLCVDGGTFDRISAGNVTERYRITEELREKNTRLQDVQRRMKQAVELSGEVFVRQEEANARAALHNQLGQVLLMDRHWLEHPERTDGAAVALLTRQMNRFLLGETGAPAQEAEDGLQRAVRLAKSIGVTVELRGEPPRGGEACAILGQAIREGAANTVKHAEGDRLVVEILKKGGSDLQYAEIRNTTEGPQAGNPAEGLEIRITNNGRPPRGPVAESGGLLSLRRAVEAAGGQMDLQSVPCFALTLRL